MEKEAERIQPESKKCKTQHMERICRVCRREIDMEHKEVHELETTTTLHPDNKHSGYKRRKSQPIQGSSPPHTLITATGRHLRHHHISYVPRTNNFRPHGNKATTGTRNRQTGPRQSTRPG